MSAETTPVEEDLPVDPFVDNAVLIGTALAYYAAHLRERAALHHRAASVDALRCNTDRTSLGDNALRSADFELATAEHIDSVLTDLDAVLARHAHRHAAARVAWLAGDDLIPGEPA